MSDQKYQIIQEIDQERPETQYDDIDDNPIKLSSVQFTAYNVPRVECHYHKGQFIVNFCQAPQCIMPLCPICIQIHSQEHINEGSYPIFVSLETLLNEVFGVVQLEASKFYHSFQDIKTHRGTFETNADRTIRKLRDIKVRIIEVVDQFFSGLENEIQHKQKKNVINQDRDANHLLRVIKDRLDSMNQMLSTLSSTKCLQAIIPYYTTTFHEDNQQYYLKIDEYINQFPTVNSEIYFDHGKASELSLYLKSIIGVQHTSIPDFIGIHQLPTTKVTESTKRARPLNQSVLKMSQSRKNSLPHTEKKIGYQQSFERLTSPQPIPIPVHIPVSPQTAIRPGFVPAYHRY
ncbi:hypothetical protein pb186bvf_012606 [Paramecium bursaria]